MKVSQLSFLSLVAAMWLAAGPVFAQLTLGASASASTDEGVSGSADADAQSDADDATVPEPDPVPIAAPAPNPEPVADTTLDEPNVETLGGEGVAGWDKGFYIQTPDKNFKLKINSCLKTRFAYYNDEVQVIGDDGSPGTNHINHAAFGLPYWRLAFSGNVFSPRLTYSVMYDFAVGTLPEATVDWAFIPEKLHLSVGVFKRPFDRDYINSTAANNFIFNSIGAMGGGADVGIMISNDYTRVKGIEWAFGVFNFSEGDNAPNALFDDFAPSLVGRFGYNNGVNGYQASDFDGGPFRFGVGVSAATEFDHDDDDITSHFIGVDAIFKVHGLSISAAVFFEAIAEEAIFDGPEFNRIGTYIKAGYLIKKRLEPVLRYSLVDNHQFDEDLSQEITAGLNWYIFGQNLKWENNFSLYLDRRDTTAINPDPETLHHILFASQLQFGF
ncbi:MAG: OprO/OprP family phosphate-selective porin [Proteobacteria bacterium]|nr:OprO/OprP family phosphate-selective porin [Pseudomonadota bacterium]